MNEQRFETNESPQLSIPVCGGNVVIQSWRETAVSAQGADVTIEQTAPNALSLTAVGDLYLAVPKQTRLMLGSISGALTIKHVSGGVTVDEAAGGVTLRNVTAVTITRAAADVQGDNINGLLVVEEAGGAIHLRSASAVQIRRALADVTLQFVNGHVALGQVDGRLDIRTVNGDLVVDKALGDVILANLGGQVSLLAAQSVWLVGGLASGSHRLAADGSVYVYWPPDAPLNLTARGPLVEHRLPLEKATAVIENDQTVLTGHIEEGKVDLVVQAGQRAAIKALTGDPPQFNEADFQFVAATPGHVSKAELAAVVQAVMAEIAVELPPATLAQLTAVRLEERLVAAVIAAMPPVPQTEPPAEVSITDQQRHILQLLKDGLLSVAQAQLLLETL